MTQFDSDLRPEIERVRAIRDAVGQLKVAPDIKSVDGRDLGDIAGTLTLLEYLISKYQERRTCAACWRASVTRYGRPPMA